MEDAKEYQKSPNLSPNYYYSSSYANSKSLSLLVVPMQAGSSIYKLDKTIKGNETSLKEVFASDLSLAKAIFDPYSPQDPPSFRVYRRSLDVIKELHGKALHVLILKSEGHKFPRNPNAHILELYCSTYFFGPLVVAMNGTEKPYALESFDFKGLELIKEDNLRVHRIYPPPYDTSYPTMEYAEDFEDSPGSDHKNLLDSKGKPKHSDTFFMYRYKTAYCPNIANKHDWTLCIYAHRFTDYRRPPDLFDYSPEECRKINPETGECPDGDNCKFSHSTAERLYHPLKYKTSPCDCFKKMMATCKRGQNCAFYHNIMERRQPESPSKNPFRKRHLEKPAVAEELKLPLPSSPGEPSTGASDEPNFEATGKRHRWTVHTTQEKLLKKKELIKSGFADAEALTHTRSEYDLCRSNLSSLVNSFCSSKGLPYYTELAFEDREDSGNEAEGTLLKEEKLEDKFNVLDQIGTPTNSAFENK